MNDFQSVKLALREYEIFGRVSGLVCNLSKCEAMALGTTQPQPLLYNNEEIKWVEEMTITGIIFGKSNEALREKNFESVLDKLQSKLNNWKQGDLSLIGKIQILKTFVRTRKPRFPSSNRGAKTGTLYLSHLVSCCSEHAPSAQHTTTILSACQSLSG